MLRTLRRPLPWALPLLVALCALPAMAQSTAVAPQKAAAPKKGEGDRVVPPSSTVETAHEPAKGKPSKGGAEAGRDKVDATPTSRPVHTAADPQKSSTSKATRAPDRVEAAETRTAQERDKGRSRVAPEPPKKARADEPKPTVVRAVPGPTAGGRVPQGRPAERPR